MKNSSQKKCDEFDDAFSYPRNLSHQDKNAQGIKPLEILCNVRSHLVATEEEDTIRMVYGYPLWCLIWEC